MYTWQSLDCNKHSNKLIFFSRSLSLSLSLSRLLYPPVAVVVSRRQSWAKSRKLWRADYLHKIAWLTHTKWRERGEARRAERSSEQARLADGGDDGSVPSGKRCWMRHASSAGSRCYTRSCWDSASRNLVNFCPFSVRIKTKRNEKQKRKHIFIKSTAFETEFAHFFFFSAW